MPTPPNLASLEITFEQGYFPSAPALAPEELQRTIRRGSNVWLRPGGKIEVANGLSEVSSTNVGARIFAADIQRAVIAGGLSGSRLPYAGLFRYSNAVLFFLSENTSSNVYLNESALTTTSSTAGRLRVAIPDGGGGYNTFDAGFAKPTLVSGDVAVATSGVLTPKAMAGAIGVAVVPWRSKTNAQGPPSDTIYNNLTATGSNLIRISLPSPVSGQDGWIYAGTRWGDQSGTLRVVRYIRTVPRGTFTATNGSPNLTAGVGTFFTRDLYGNDTMVIDGSGYEIASITSDSTATMTGNFTGSTSAGKTMTLASVAANWYDGELGALINRDVIRPPRAAGALMYGGRVFLWGVSEPDSASPTAATGPVILAAPDNNPEHFVLSQLSAIVTASGSDLVNVLGGDGPLYLMTTTSLEIVSVTGREDKPYDIRIVAEPGFKAVSNGVLYKDWFYGFNNRPLRTRARENIDVVFAKDVWEDMEGWDAQRVMIAVDPSNDAILYIYDNGASTVVIPYMAQLSRWGPPINFSARIIDTAVVNGVLYVTYLSGGNYRVNAWEGGSGIGGTRYVASQYYDTRSLSRNRIKNLVANGKIGSVSVYATTPGAAVPDVSDLGAVAATFNQSNTAEMSEGEIFTNIEARAAAVRVDFSSNDGNVQKVVARGIPKAERR